MSKTTYLYVIAGENTWPATVKVGISSDPSSRLKGVQTGNPARLKIHYAFKLPTREAASWIERRVHEQAEEAEARLFGEWLQATPDCVICWIANAINDYVGNVMFPDVEGSDENVFAITKAILKFSGVEHVENAMFGIGEVA